MLLKCLRIATVVLAMLVLVLPGACAFAAQSVGDGSIRPYGENRWYWEYREDPVLLIGGSDEDNLYQWTGARLTDHLDLLVSVGGNYVRNTMSDRAAQAIGRKVYVTTMQFDPSNSVRHALTHRDLYSFVEISQNNQDSRGGRGQGHWDNIMSWRGMIATHAGGPMPMNNEKVYGAVDGVNYSAGSETEAMNRFWRNVFAGCASSRFHRPADPSAWGSGLNERAQRNLRAMRMLLEELDIFSCSPHNDLLSHRVAVPSTMEAYATANIGRQYAVYFPPGRYTVDLDPWVYVSTVQVRWLDIDRLSWSEPTLVDVEWEGAHDAWGDRGRITLTTPSNRPYAVLLNVPE